MEAAYFLSTASSRLAMARGQGRFNRSERTFNVSFRDYCLHIITVCALRAWGYYGIPKTLLLSPFRGLAVCPQNA